MNTLLINALRCQNLLRPPIWLMRQAGRYMADYRALRQKHTFLEMVHDPRLAAEVTLLPINLLQVDAAILFSDILVMVEALGLKLTFLDKSGPHIENPLEKSEDINSLHPTHISEKLSYIGDAVRLLKPELKVPLIGFCGAPFTLASYMIEGKASHDLRKTKLWMLKEPDSFHRLLQIIADCSIEYLQLQIKAGVDAVQIFDTWAIYLGYAQFKEFSLNYLQKIVQALKNSPTPIILFCKGSSALAPDLASIAPSAISLDWNCSLANIRKQVPSPIALQGNLDPDILYAPRPTLQKEAKRLLAEMKGDPGYIFNLGHGVLPDMSLDQVRCLVDTVKESA